mgnify:CR=1 FL=1|jgi:predicted transcriptional regulator
MNTRNREDAVTLEILEAIEEDSDVTQRGLAQRSGVALGLANSYLKRCVRKGLVKIQQAPANRYLYYLTPKGFVEKSRLTAEYLSYSVAFYRRASDSCAGALAECREQERTEVGLYGASDLAEIVALRATEFGVRVAGIADPANVGDDFRDHIVVASPQTVAADAWILTDLRSPKDSLDALVAQVPREQVLVPGILGLRV